MDKVLDGLSGGNNHVWWLVVSIQGRGKASKVEQ
jgi:hypothetical protein